MNTSTETNKTLQDEQEEVFNQLLEELVEIIDPDTLSEHIAEKIKKSRLLHWTGSKEHIAEKIKKSRLLHWTGSNKILFDLWTHRIMVCTQYKLQDWWQESQKYRNQLNE